MNDALFKFSAKYKKKSRKTFKYNMVGGKNMCFSKFITNKSEWNEK